MVKNGVKGYFKKNIDIQKQIRLRFGMSSSKIYIYLFESQFLCNQLKKYKRNNFAKQLIAFNKIKINSYQQLIKVTTATVAAAET